MALKLAGPVLLGAALLLAACGGDSPTGEDGGAPRILEWIPAGGSTVGGDLAEISIRFSEPVDRETFVPESADARLMLSVIWESGFEDPGQWNADSTRFTVPLGGLPAGVELFLDMAPFRDAEGQWSADPEPYTLQVSGEAQEFFWEDGFQWFYLSQVPGREEEPGIFRIVSESSEIGDFELTRHVPVGPGEWEPDWIRHFQGEHDDLDYLGFSFREGDAWIINLFDAPLHFFRAQGAWQSQTGMTVDFGEGPVTGTMSLEAAILGREDRVSILSEMDGEEGPGELVLPDCAALELDYEIRGEHLGDPEALFRAGNDTLWICPGVGPVRERSAGQEWDRHTQAMEPYRVEDDLFVWGPKGFELPEE